MVNVRRSCAAQLKQLHIQVEKVALRTLYIVQLKPPWVIAHTCVHTQIKRRNELHIGSLNSYISRVKFSLSDVIYSLAQAPTVPESPGLSWILSPCPGSRRPYYSSNVCPRRRLDIFKLWLHLTTVAQTAVYKVQHYWLSLTNNSLLLITVSDNDQSQCRPYPIIKKVRSLLFIKGMEWVEFRVVVVAVLIISYGSRSSSGEVGVYAMSTVHRASNIINLAIII